uniref:ARAD1D38940p n=1 Tax=Blastobotrys adeninivorans TaxID=409370 RepID=A0A060TCV7_BLAAD
MLLRAGRFGSFGLPLFRIIRPFTVMSSVMSEPVPAKREISPPPRPPKKKVKVKKYKEPPVDPVSSEGVLINDIKSLLQSKGISEQNVINDMQEFFSRPKGEPHPEHGPVTVKIEGQSSVGDGIGLYEVSPDRYRVITVPFALAGETVEAKVFKTFKYYFQADLIKVVTPSPVRNNDLIKCKYFGQCSGCQYQMIPYENQLEMKRQVIVNAFKHYATGIDRSRLPEVLPTMASPLTHGYRTKLTPHFDVPRQGLQAPPPIGFGIKGQKKVLDIEECPIGTSIVNKGMTEQRKHVHDNYASYKRGATLLLRENALTPEERVCTTSTKEIITEYIDQFKFQYPAGSFFQNNNSILPLVTAYVRDNIVLPSTGKLPKYLVDTYCGSGLFAVTCSTASESVIGVEISKDSVAYAQKNADMNGVKNASFIVGEAEKIFEKVNTNPEDTSIIIDPPRKGCDKAFLDQLLDFSPAKVVYVSCNVHSQARDIEYILSDPRNKYKVESIRGFDFFPQTHHVESVAVLST